MSVDGVIQFENCTGSLVTSVLQSDSESAVVKGNGIDYFRDVNIAAEDVIKLLKATFENIERSVVSKSPGNDATQTSNDTSQAAYEFLDKLRFLINYTEKRIRVSPTEQQEQDRKLRYAVRSSRKTEMDIKVLNDVLALQRIEHKKSVDKLNEELNTCRNAIDQRRENYEKDVKKIVNESGTKMVEFYKESSAIQDQLDSEIKIVETRLKNLRRSNILMEKQLREKRCKVEAQLMSCLAKYDADIGGRNKELENLVEDFQSLNLQKNMLEDNVMVDLRSLHDDLQHEKAEALLKILNEKVAKFVRNRAARIIQKAWRAYWERHCAKKKKKSRKK